MAARREDRVSVETWTGANLARQGYCLTAAQRRELRVALRFSTGVCLALVVIALVLESAPMVFALSAIGLIAGFAPRHPFDLAWNHAVRHVLRGPALPPNPTRRRHSFKVAGVWLALVGVLFAAGATTAALVVGGMLIAGCTAVTALNFCPPSEALAWWERHIRDKEVVTT
jgi:Domain of unknown function (DUF4395)